MNKPLLIIIAGPNGSGKTTITSRVIQHQWAETCEYINPDEIAQQMFGDWNDSESVIKAAQYATQRRNWLVDNRKDLIFETVLSSQEKVNFVKKAKDAGYFIRIFFISTSHPAINASRVALRVMKGGHDVPIQKIISRYNKSIENMFAILPIVDRAYFYDNSIEDREAQILFRFSNGILQKQYVHDVPLWAIALLQNHIPPKE